MRARPNPKSPDGLSFQAFLERFRECSVQNWYKSNSPTFRIRTFLVVGGTGASFGNIQLRQHTTKYWRVINTHPQTKPHAFDPEPCTY